MPYFHGSFDKLEIGLNLRPQDGTGSTVETLDRLFEECRPTRCIPRTEAVYLVRDPDLIDAVGGFTEFVYEVRPEGTPEGSDLAWLTEAQLALEEGDADRARNCASNYWAGIPFEHADRSVFEYRVRSATIVREAEGELDFAL
jgi:hypothetical protein